MNLISKEQVMKFLETFAPLEPGLRDFLLAKLEPIEFKKKSPSSEKARSPGTLDSL